MENEKQIMELLTQINNKLDKLSERVSEIELYQENALLPMIKLVAENHIDLTRKLDSAIDSQLERDLIKMKIRTLEGDVRRLKFQ